METNDFHKWVIFVAVFCNSAWKCWSSAQ